MSKKIKTYVIFVSLTYPAYHSKKGQPTYFVEKIQLGLNMLVELPGDFLIDLDPKLHTLRANLPLWKKRIDEVLAGKAVIVLKYHTLGRYVKGNKQIEFVRLDKDSGVGIQEFIYDKEDCPFDGFPIRNVDSGSYRMVAEYVVAENDGLLYQDFTEWFKKGKYNLKEPMACIHFTSFRYGALYPEK